MEHIADKLFESLYNGNILLAVTIIAVALAFYYKKIIEFIGERKKERIITITEALKCNFVTGLTKSHLEEELATEHFKMTTGIRLEKGFREAVIQAYKRTNGELDFVHFKRALPHLSYQRSTLSVKVSVPDRIHYYLNWILGFVSILMGMIFLMVLPNRTESINFIQSMSILGMGCICIAFSMFLLSQTLPVVSARRVRKHLSKQFNSDDR